jgi:hypothetical protein
MSASSRGSPHDTIPTSETSACAANAPTGPTQSGPAAVAVGAAAGSPRYEARARTKKRASVHNTSAATSRVRP